MAIKFGRVVTGSSGSCAGRLVVPAPVRSAVVAIAIAGLLSACGSSTGTAGGGGHTNARHGSVVSARRLGGIGTVLVNQAGKTIYSPDQEAHGKIMCTGSCLSFWFPVTVASGATLPAPSGVSGRFGTIQRPTGSQLTYNGRPLYTFRLDNAPGQAMGNDFTDHFGGVSFTWRAVTTTGTPASTPSSGNQTGGYSYSSGAPGY